MKRIDTKLPGVCILEPVVHGDQRGYFMETYSTAAFAAVGIDTVFVQDNQSMSVKGVLRGLHGIVGHPGKMHQCGLYGKALLLQNAHSNGSVHAAVQPNKNLILLFKCIKTQCSVHNILLYQRCAVRQACFPPYFLLCSTAKRSQRSFSGWPAWPFSQW